MRFVPMSEIIGKNDYNLNISRYIDSGISEDLQSIEAHLKGGIPAYDSGWHGTLLVCFRFTEEQAVFLFCVTVSISSMFPRTKCTLIHEDEEFSSYADKIDNAFVAWRSAVDQELRSINASRER